MGMGGVMGGWRKDGDEGSDGGGEWGVGEGVGTDGRGGSAAGLSSSVCALVVCVRAGRLRARSSFVCVLVVRVRARRPVRGRSLCVGGASSLSKGGASSPWVGLVSCGRWVVVLFVGGGRQLWVWGVFRGRWVVVRGCWVVDCRGWGPFAWAGCSWVLVCRSWARC